MATGPTPAPSAPLAGKAAEDVKDLVALLEKMKGQTHFEVLGVAKEADATAVKIAYFKLAKNHHPDTVPPGAPAEFAKAKADVFARIGEANRVLSDTRLRAEYMEDIKGGGTGEKVDISRFLQAEECFVKGQILVKARKFPEAIKMLDDAIAGNADEGEFYAYRGFARFFTFTDKKEGYAAAMKDISICLQKNPNVASVYYFQGFMQKVLGELANAKANFQKCVKLDPRHIDAQRELRTK